jgi:hypothetical protein
MKNLLAKILLISSVVFVGEVAEAAGEDPALPDSGPLERVFSVHPLVPQPALGVLGPAITLSSDAPRVNGLGETIIPTVVIIENAPAEPSVSSSDNSGSSVTAPLNNPTPPPIPSPSPPVALPAPASEGSAVQLSTLPPRPTDVE